MSDFTLHNTDSAPEKSKPLLEGSQKAFGMIPNLHAVMAESPELLEAYQVVHKLFSASAFDKNELTVVWQTINKEHNCHYCLPAHSGVARMMGADEAVDSAVRNGAPLSSEKLEVLRETTLAMVRERGVISAEQLDKFYSAGFDQRHLLDIILGLSQKVMSNYTNHVAKTPVDDAFKKFI